MKKLTTILGIAVVAGIMLAATAGTADAAGVYVNVRFNSGYRASSCQQAYYGSYYPAYYYSTPAVTYSYGYGSGRVIYVAPQPAVVYAAPVYYTRPAAVYYSTPAPSYYQCSPPRRSSRFSVRHYGR